MHAWETMHCKPCYNYWWWITKRVHSLYRNNPIPTSRSHTDYMCSLQCIYSDISQFPRSMHTSHSWDVMQFIFLLSLCKNNVSLGFVNLFIKTGDYRSLNHLDRYFYPSGAWTRIFLQNEIDTIVVDAMALWAVMLLAKNKQGIVFHYNMTVWHFGPCVTFWPCLCEISARLVWQFGPLVRNEGKRVSL